MIRAAGDARDQILTFIAGVYGMNFAYMPEIRHPWGYPAALASVAAAMLLYFRKKGWI